MNNEVLKLPNRAESKERIKPYYTALFVKDMATLLKRYSPKHAKIYGHHSTIAFEPPSLDGINVGAETKLRIVGRAYDEKGDVLLVENDKSNNTHPHITLSCAEGVSPAYSNQLIERALESNTVEYFSDLEEIDVVEGYSDGANTIVTL